MAARNVHSAFEVSATISGISFANEEEISLTITCCPLSKRRVNDVGAATNGRNGELQAQRRDLCHRHFNLPRVSVAQVGDVRRHLA